VIGFIEHLYAQLVTTDNYNSLTGLHTLNITVSAAHIKSSMSSLDTETLIDASKEFVLEVNTEKTKYTLLSRYQNAGKNHDIKRADRYLKMWQSSDIWERVEQIKT
jgi:hypothetical protein